MTARSSSAGDGADLILAGLALAVIAALLVLAPHRLVDMADRAAYAVCHRIPDHSFTIAGRQLPLCARCSGTYLGALAGLIVLRATGKGRAGRFPARPYLVVLGGFMILWAADGVNSFLALLDLPHLYEPSNGLRLVTGTLEGIAIAAVLLPAFNMTVWAVREPVASIERPADLLWLLLGAGVVILAVGSGWGVLVYPLALLSGAMVVALLGSLNTMLYLAARRREGAARGWRDAAPALVIGVGLALCEIALIGAGRDALTVALGLPF
jgi:uncharacterized membrane protein